MTSITGVGVAARMPRGRTAWLRVHRWFALSVGWLLAAVASMGAMLVVARPLDVRAHPELFVARSGVSPAFTVPLETIRQTMVAEFGRDADLNFRPPRMPSDTLWVTIHGRWDGIVYLDPATGREQGRRREDEGFVNVLFRIHSSLGLKDTGRAVLAIVALGYLVLLTTGLILWWPRRWPPSLRLVLGQGRVPAFLSLHKALGAVMGVLIAVSVATGAFMAWRPIGNAITFLSGARAFRPHPLVKDVAAPGGVVSVDQLVAKALARFPQATVAYVQIPAKPGSAVRIRLHVPDDPHPNGLTSVWLDPRTDAVVDAVRWNALDPGARAAAILYPLHTGELGGTALESLVFFNGASLGALGFSGLALWWLRRRRARTK